MKATRLPSRFVLLLAVGALAAVLAAVDTRAQGPPKKESAPAATREVFVYQPKKANATEVVRILREVYGGGGKDGTGRYMEFSADERNNTVAVNAGPEEQAQVVKQVEKLIKALDVESPGHEQRAWIVPLGSLTPDPYLSEALQIFCEGRRAKFAVDQQRRVVVVSGNERTYQEARVLIETLKVEQTKLEVAEAYQQRVGELRVRIVWLMSGLKGEDVAMFPPDFADVTAELARLGIEKPRLAAQVLVNTPMSVPFRVNGSAQLQLDSRLKVAVVGTVNGTPGAPRLQIDLNVHREVEDPPAVPKGGRQPLGTPICSLNTQITTPLGHAVVLGVTPTMGTTSIFVVQVLGKEEPRRKSSQK